MKIKQLLNFALIFIFFKNFTASTDGKIEKTATGAETPKYERKNLFETCFGDNKFVMNVKNRTENFYATSTKLLSGSDLDRVVYPQTTWDLTSFVELDKGVKAQVVLRNKSRWGNPNSIAQTT